jgi:hypothetical protein
MFGWAVGVKRIYERVSAVSVDVHVIYANKLRVPMLLNERPCLGSTASSGVQGETQKYCPASVDAKIIPQKTTIFVRINYLYGAQAYFRT